MKIVKIIGVAAAMLIVFIVAAIVFLPSTAHMERSIWVATGPEKVYRELITYRNFAGWFPWARRDAGATLVYTGPEYGIGARITWQSTDPDVGSGYMEIVEVKENELVTNRFGFDGYDSYPMTSFILEPVQDSTRITWMYDESGVSGLEKLFALGIDGFLGAHFEDGLQRLKKRVESAPGFRNELDITHMRGLSYLGITDSSANDPALVATKMARGFGALMEFVGKRAVEVKGHPMVIYHSYADTDLIFTCALPVAGPISADSELIFMDQIPESLAIRATHLGGYSGLEQAHAEVEAFAAFYGYGVAGHPWEEYVTDPSLEPDTARWQTHVYYPVK